MLVANTWKGGDVIKSPVLTAPCNYSGTLWRPNMEIAGHITKALHGHLVSILWVLQSDILVWGSIRSDVKSMRSLPSHFQLAKLVPSTGGFARCHRIVFNPYVNDNLTVWAQEVATSSYFPQTLQTDVGREIIVIWYSRSNIRHSFPLGITSASFTRLLNSHCTGLHRLSQRCSTSPSVTERSRKDVAKSKEITDIRMLTSIHIIIHIYSTTARAHLYLRWWSRHLGRYLQDSRQSNCRRKDSGSHHVPASNRAMCLMRKQAWEGNVSK